MAFGPFSVSNFRIAQVHLLIAVKIGEGLILRYGV
jgi:hypothetical protein